MERQQVGHIKDEMLLSHIAADIVGLWDKLKFSKFRYIEKSLGVMVGYELALTYKRRLQSLTWWQRKVICQKVVLKECKEM